MKKHNNIISGFINQKPGAQNYNVGYGKPPKNNQFQKGRSGNPAGRPKGSMNKLPFNPFSGLMDSILKEAAREVTITDNGRSIKLVVAQAVARSVALNALKGRSPAQRLFFELVAATESARNQTINDCASMALQYKVDCQVEMDRCCQMGQPAPEFLPHPDHVVIDGETKKVSLIGPGNKEQKKIYDNIVVHLKESVDALNVLRSELDKQADAATRVQIQSDIEEEEDTLAWLLEIRKNKSLWAIM